MIREKFEVKLRTNKFIRRIYFALNGLKFEYKTNHFDKIKNIVSLSNPQLVLDVGANLGQFICDLEIVGYQGNVIAFEPIPKAFSYLIKKYGKNNRYSLLNKALVSQEVAQRKMQVASNIGMSSSFLRPTENHFRLAPKVNFNDEIYVECITPKELEIDIRNLKSDRVLLKIDTQGFEYEILESLSKIECNIVGIIIETSFLDLYEESKGFYEICNLLKSLHFRIIDISMNGYIKDLQRWSYCDIFAIQEFSH